MSLKYDFMDEILWFDDRDRKYRRRYRKHEMPISIYNNPRSYVFKSYYIDRDITFFNKEFFVSGRIYANGYTYISTLK